MVARINRRKKRTYNSSECDNQNAAKRRINESLTPCQVKISHTPKPFQFQPNVPFLQKNKGLEFDHSSFGTTTTTENLLNESTELYEELKGDSTIPFKAKHLICEEIHRQKILNSNEVCRRLLRRKKTYRVKLPVHRLDPFLEDILSASGTEAQARYEQMLDKGFFRPGRNIRNTIILSMKDGIVLHMVRLKNNMFDFNLIIETKPCLMEHLGRHDRTDLINHYSAKNLCK